MRRLIILAGLLAPAGCDNKPATPPANPVPRPAGGLQPDVPSKGLKTGAKEGGPIAKPNNPNN